MKFKVLAVIATLAILLIVVGTAAAEFVYILWPTVTITTDPLVYFEDVDGWLYPGYDPYDTLDVAWLEYPFATAYEVGIVGEDGLYLQWGDHWASNPNGLTFTFGGYVPEPCDWCMYQVWVWPKVHTQYLDTATGQYEYEYAYLVI